MKTCKRICAAALLAALFAVPAWSFAGGGLRLAAAASPAALESALAAAFPYGEPLAASAFQLQTLAGQDHVGAYFYSENAIIPDIPAASAVTTATNLAAMADFCARPQPAGYFFLVPTAAAIRQSEISSLVTARLFNQKQYITQAYRTASGYLRTIDVYAALLARQNDYLYYRTDPHLTALGGYCLYAAAAPSMGYSARAQSAFDVALVAHDYTGPLAAELPYFSPKPDILSLYHYQRHAREYLVTTRIDGRLVRRTTLYPTDALLGDDPLQVYLGELGGVSDLRVIDGPYETTLLVFTDHSTRSFLPLLVNHYARITVVDLSAASADELRAISPAAYDQVLFAYSVDAFGQTDLSAQLALVGGE